MADLAPLDARPDVQGVSDMGMGLAAAAAGALSGVIVAGWGYTVLAGFAAVLCGGVVLAGVATPHGRAAGEAAKVDA